jgi:hypothetical protein
LSAPNAVTHTSERYSLSSTSHTGRFYIEIKVNPCDNMWEEFFNNTFSHSLYVESITWIIINITLARKANLSKKMPVIRFKITFLIIASCWKAMYISWSDEFADSQTNCMEGWTKWWS